MVLVLLGTQQNEFNRLLKKIEELIEDGTIKEEVMVQAGVTKFESKYMKQFDLIPKNEIEDLKKQASYIITHGGVGSIVSCIKMGKKVIAVPRLAKYGEHVNDHQIQIVENMQQKGYIEGVIDIKELKEAIQKIDGFTPKKYESNTEKMINIVSEYIEKN